MQCKQFANIYPDGAEDFRHDVSFRGLHDVERLPQDEEDGGEQHEDRGHPEGQGVAGVIAEAVDVLPARLNS